MAIPKTLRPISEKTAMSRIRLCVKNGTGAWEGPEMYSDFVYETKAASWLIRPTKIAGKWEFETGKVSM